MKNPKDHLDVQLLADIYRRYADDLLRYFLSYCRDRMQAEDMLHDLMLRVMALDVLNEHTAKNLLLCAARNMIVDDARHRAICRRVEQDIQHSIVAYEYSGIERKIDLDTIRRAELRAVGKLSRMRCIVYKMWRDEQKDTAEIATSLGLSKRTVETHLYQSRKFVVGQLRRAV